MQRGVITAVCLLFADDSHKTVKEAGAIGSSPKFPIRFKVWNQSKGVVATVKKACKTV